MVNSFIAFFVALGLASGYYTYTPKDVTVAVVPESDNVQIEELMSMKAAIKAKLELSGIPEAEVNIRDNTILIDIPSEDMRQTVIDAVKTENVIEFTDAEGNVLLDMSHIKSAEQTYGLTSSYSIYYEYYITIEFTEKGREKFKEATEKAVAKKESGENYILITLNGEVISCPIVEDVIYSDTCIITGNFDKETVEELALLINSGKMNIEINVID